MQLNIGLGFGNSAPTDTTPDAFTITAQTGVALSTTITSASFEPTGYTSATTITVTGGKYQINGAGGFVSTEGTLSPGDTVEAQVDSSGLFGTAATCTITIGGVSAVFSVTTAAPTGATTAEANALIAFYNATNGPSWTNKTGWATLDPTISNWSGVTVYGGHVTQLNLSSNGATTSGPGLQYLSGLTSLTNLNLFGTGATGNISSLTGLTSLTYLNLSNTTVIGNISNLAGLINLTYFDLSSTAVTYTTTTLPAWNNINLQTRSLVWAQAMVDLFLCDWASAGGSGGSLNISGANAAPSAAGLTCRDTLISQGRTVTVST